jgi:uncharacterized protein involved in exopolysaccharide biosynthesis
MMELRFFLSLFLRRLPHFLAVFVICASIGVGVATVLPPVFVAEARLLVEAEQIPGSLAASTVQTQASEQLQIIENRMMTRANLLDLGARMQVFRGQPMRPADEQVAEMRRRVTITRLGPPTRRPGEGATLVTVAFQAPTSDMAARVANELAAMILKEDVALRTGVAGQTLAFFRQQVTRLDRELVVLGQRIVTFRQENHKALPDNLDYRRSRQIAVQERLIQLDRDTASLAERRARLVELYERTGRVDVLAEMPTPEQRLLQTARAELASALAVYSPTHPQVNIYQTQVANLEAQVASQLAGPNGHRDDALSLYDVQLADIDVQVAAIAGLKEQSEAEIDSLQQGIDATPGNAIRLETLERDYANLRAQFDQAVANRARAETGDLIESQSRGERISVVEQAIAPRRPGSPNRPLIAMTGAGVGMILGSALVLLLELFNRAIRRPVELTDALGIVPFATLPYILTPDESRRQTSAVTGMLIVVIAGVPAALWAVDRYYLPLDLLMERTVSQLGGSAQPDQPSPLPDM